MADAAHSAELAQGGEHATGAFPPFDLSLFPHQLVWFAISFGVLYYLLSRYVLPKVGAVIDKRAGVIKSDLDGAHAASSAAEAARANAEKAQAQARAEARKLIDDMRAKAQAEASAEQAKAEAVLAERLAAAETRINAARTAALADVEKIAGDLAQDIANQLIGARA